MPKACSLYFEADVVFCGTVEADGYINDKEEPDFYAFRSFSVKVRRVLKGNAGIHAQVVTPMNTARASIDVGKEYTFFAKQSTEGLDVRCYDAVPGDLVLADIAALGRATTATVEGQVSEPGVRVTVTGASGTFSGLSGANGDFSVVVPPGTYRVSVPSDIEQYEPYSNVDLSRVALKPGQCAQIAFQRRR